MDDSLPTQGGSPMFKVSQALLSKANKALDEAQDLEGNIEIVGTGMIVCPREKQPDKGFEPFTFINRNGRFFAVGPYRK